MNVWARWGDVATRGTRWVPEGYLILALVLTGFLSVLTAPFATPDEEHHAARAISLSHGEWMARPGVAEFGAAIDANALLVMDGMDRGRMEWERSAGEFHDRRHGAVTEGLQARYAGVRWAGTTAFAPFPNTAVYPPVLYLPSMAGWRVGEAAGLTIFDSLRLARVLCAFSAVGLGWLALRICPVGSRWVLGGFLLLPSTLFLNASCSQDATLLALPGLVMALIVRALVERRELRWVELGVAAGLLGLCGTARPPYLPIALLVFLPGAELGRGSWRRWVAPTIAFGCVVMVGAWWRWLVAPVGFDSADWADPEKQTALLQAHAFAGGWIVAKGTMAAAVDFVRRGLYVVGWNDLLPGHGAGFVLALCLGVMVVFAPQSPVRTWAGRALLMVGLGGSLAGISLAEYVIWTPPGGHEVYGVQPRYWLPLMPLGLLLLRSLMDASAWGRSRARRWVLAGCIGVLVLVACTLPWMVAEAFYRESVARVLWLNLR